MDCLHIRKLEKDEIKKYREDFNKNGGFVLRNMINKNVIDYLNKEINFSKGNNRNRTQFNREWAQTPNSTIITDILHNKLTLEINKIFDKKYYRTYNFGLLYNKNSEVYPHLDVISNELSSTCVFNTEKDYPIYIDNRHIENKYTTRYTTGREFISSDNVVKLDIKLGDIGVFNGRNHFHFRDKLIENINYKAILFHWSTCIEYKIGLYDKREPENIKDMEYYNKNISWGPVPHLNSTMGIYYNR